MAMTGNAAILAAHGKARAASRDLSLLPGPPRPPRPPGLRLGGAKHRGLATLGQRASCALHWQSIDSPCNGRDARCPSTFGQANGWVRKPGLPFPGGLGGPGGPGPPAGKWQFLAGGPPTPSGTPIGRPAHSQWHPCRLKIHFFAFTPLPSPVLFDKLHALAQKGSEFAIRSERERSHWMRPARSKRSCVPGRRHGRFRVGSGRWRARLSGHPTPSMARSEGLAGNGATPPGGIGVVNGQEAKSN